MSDEYDPDQSEMAKHAALMHRGMIAFATGHFDEYMRERYDQAIEQFEALWGDDTGTTTTDGS